jgi:hypothetical protein
MKRMFLIGFVLSSVALAVGRSEAAETARPSVVSVLPENGLAQYDFLYAGESKQRRAFIVRKGQVVWSYDIRRAKRGRSDHHGIRSTHLSPNPLSSEERGQIFLFCLPRAEAAGLFSGHSSGVSVGAAGKAEEIADRGAPLALQSLQDWQQFWKLTQGSSCVASLG